jgi:SAM-dependent methyltransferase
VAGEEARTGVAARSKVVEFSPWEVRGSDLKSIPNLLLGCGHGPKPDCVNLDIVSGPRVDIVQDVTDVPWCWPDGEPIEDEHFSSIQCSHVLEHIPHRIFAISRVTGELTILPMDGLVMVMNEAWRVLKPGGVMDICVPHAGNGRAYQDPTHVRFFVAETWAYFGTPKEMPQRTRKEIDEWMGGSYLQAETEFIIETNEVLETTGDLYTLLVKPDGKTG